MAVSEEASVVALVQQELTNTPYACSSLARMSAGTTNYVFRGTLFEPLTAHNGLRCKTIIIKHAKDHVPENESFPLDLSRCVMEESMLASLNTFPNTSQGVTTPHLYLFKKQANIMVIADLPDALDLKSILVSPRVNTTLTPSVTSSIGRRLGAWLRAFHDWGSHPAQLQLLNKMGQNKAMRDLKYKITYGSFIRVLRDFPSVLGDDGMLLEEVRLMATKEFEMASIGDVRQGWGLIHGDFWTGNFLLTTTPTGDISTLGTSELFIIDWEFAQFGNWAYDLGQMIGDIYEREHFHDIDNALLMIREFVEGYGGLSDQLAFRTAIQVGVQLLGWYTRRAPGSPVYGTPSQVNSAVVLGKEFVLRGWQKDRLWFKESVLASLFG